MVLNGSLLYAARHAILSEKPTQFSATLSWLHADFHPQCAAPR